MISLLDPASHAAFLIEAMPYLRQFYEMTIDTHLS